MNKKKKYFPHIHSEAYTLTSEDENSDRRNAVPDDPSEKTGPRIREMPLTGVQHHPHDEEILDSVPK